MDEFVHVGPYGYIEESNYNSVQNAASTSKSGTDKEQSEEIANLNEAVAATSEAVAENTNNIEALQNDVQEIKEAGYQTEDEVKAAIAEVVDGAPEALDTLKEIAEKLSDNDDAVANLVNSVSEAKAEAEAADAKADAVKEELTAEIEKKADAETLDETNAAVAALSDKVDAIEVPSLDGYATQEWVNEQGFLKEHQDISNLATKDEVAAVEAELENKANASDLSALNSTVEELSSKVENNALQSDLEAEIARAEAKEGELEESLEKKVEWVESTPGRNHIVLKNHDSVLGTATDGTTYNLAMVSKWDVADFGTAQLHANLNSKDGVVTINDDKAVATEAWVNEQGFLTEHQDITTLATKAEVVDEAERATAAESELQSNITAEQARAEAKEAELSSDMADLESTVTENMSSTLSTFEKYYTKDEVDAKFTEAGQAVGNAIDSAVMGLASEDYVDGKVADLATEQFVNDSLVGLATAADVEAATKDLATEEYVDNTVEGYVPVEQYNELKARLDEIEIMLSIYNAEREAQIDEIISNMSSDNKEVVTDTLMESIVVPETTVAYTITAPLTDNSTVELTSPKYMTLINTSKEPVSTTISHEYAEGETATATSVYLVGDFDTLTLENISPSVKSGYNAASVKNVVIPETNVKNLSLALDFQDGATITNNSDKDITITDKNNSAIALTVVAPNSTVTLSSGQFTTLNAEVSDNTLIIKKNVHIANLNLEKGNAIVEVARQEEVAAVVENYTVADGYSVSHRIYHITNENTSKLGGVGEMILDEDITRTASIVAPLAPAYDAVWNLNGHSLTVEGTPKSGVYLNRYASNLEVKGEGVIRCEGSYGLWNSATTGKIVINEGVTVEAQTHAIYAEKGIIEINGGTFKLTNWEEAAKDENGNLRFLLNCLDANYKNGTANIVVKGGKFYDFNPANCAAEGVGTSFLAEGYESVESTETIDGVEHKVYTVKKSA